MAGSSSSNDEHNGALGGLLAEAIDWHQRGQLQEAKRRYETILAEHPNSAQALHLLGVIAHQTGDHVTALELIGRAIAITPDKSAFFNNYGAVLISERRHIEALACFHRAAALKPSYLDAISNQGLALEGMGSRHAAQAIYERILAENPQHVPTMERLGKLCRRQGDLQRAESMLKQAAAIAPNQPDILNELGCLYLAEHRASEAAEAYRQCLSLDRGYAPAAFNLGCAYAEQELTEEAQAAFAMASQLRPDKAAWKLRSISLCPAVFASSGEISAYLSTLAAQLDELNSRRPDLPLDDIAESNLFPPFGLAYLGRDVLQVKQRFASIFPERVDPFPHKIRAGRKRVGFVVTERHQGVFLRCLGGIVARLDRTAFEPVVLCSQSIISDLQRGLSCGDCEYFTFPTEITAAVSMVRKSNCDLLYYWEVGSDAINYHLARVRLAPVQCTSWGSQLSTGVPNVDYFLSSALIENEQAQHRYSERLWLAETMPTWQRRLQRPAPIERAHFGLPDDGSLYVCAQNPLKLHPDFDPLVAGILRKDPTGRVIFKQGRYPHTAHKLKQRFARTMPDVAERIVFLPWLPLADYYRLLNLASVILDPLYFGAGSTAYDAFSFDLPVVTLPGESIVGRVTTACYRRMGIEGPVVPNTETYVDRAVQLALDRKCSAALRAQLQACSHLLFENESAVREHERFFSSILETAQSG